MDEKKLLEKLDEKVDKLDTRLDKVDVHLAVYNEQLKIHIEGTVQNREAIKDLRIDLKPVERHVELVNGFFKLVGFIALVVGIVEGLSHLFS